MPITFTTGLLTIKVACNNGKLDVSWTIDNPDPKIGGSTNSTSINCRHAAAPKLQAWLDGFHLQPGDKGYPPNKKFTMTHRKGSQEVTETFSWQEVQGPNGQTMVRITYHSQLVDKSTNPPTVLHDSKCHWDFTKDESLDLTSKITAEWVECC